MLELRLHNCPDKAKDASGGIVDLLTEILDRCGYDGIWTAVPNNQTQWRAKKRFRVAKFDRTTLFVKVKPGDNSTCWNVRLIPPSGENIFAVGRELSLWNDYDGENTPDAVKANRDDATDVVPEANGKQVELVDALTEDTPRVGLEDIAARLSEAQALAKAFDERSREIETLEFERDQVVANAEKLMAKVDSIESKIARLKKERANDTKGKEAMSSLEVLRRLFA